MAWVPRSAVLFFCVAMCGCTSDSSNHRASGTDSPRASADSSHITIQPSGPVIIVADSNSSGARLEVRSGHAVLHLPAVAFKTLADSLPGFAPFPVSAYDSAVWITEVERDSTAVLPSVILDDFDGDKRVDVAMVGVSRDTTAEIMLLSNRTNTATSDLLFMNPRRSGNLSEKTDVLLRAIRADEMASRFRVQRGGVEAVDVGKGSVIFYWDNGILKQIQTGD